MAEKKTSVLVLLPLVPYPPDDGGKIASFTFIENLRSRYDFTVLVPGIRKDNLENVRRLRAQWPDVKVVCSTLSAVDSRAMASMYAEKVFSRLARVLGSSKSVFRDPDRLYPFLKIDRPYFDALDNLLKQHRYDIVQVEYAQNLALVERVPKDTKKVYVEVESRYSLLGDYVQLEPAHDVAFAQQVVAQAKSVEAAFIERFDAVLAYSRDDKTRLEELLPGKPVHVSPLNLITDPALADAVEEFSIDKLVFVGQEGHPPNKDAVLWFMEEIYPSLERYGVKFHVVGRWSKAFIEKFKSNPNVVFPGFVDDIGAYMKNSLNVVPIRLGGGGLRLKILLSLSNGTPVVTTTKAAYGFDFINGSNVFIADTAEQFIEEIADLLKDPGRAATVARNALQLYKECFSVDVTTRVRHEIYQSVLARCEASV